MGPAPPCWGPGVGRPQWGSVKRVCVLLPRGYTAAVEGWSDLVTGGDLAGEVRSLCAGFLDRLQVGEEIRGGHVRVGPASSRALALRQSLLHHTYLPADPICFSLTPSSPISPRSPHLPYPLHPVTPV